MYRQFKADTARRMAIIEQFPGAVRDMLHFEMAKAVWDQVDYAQLCESPIEQLFAIPFVRHIQRFNDKHYRISDPDLNETGYAIRLEPQHEFEFGPNRYRVDFLVSVAALGGVPPVPSVIVECDGHNYHERTKEQASRDKERDRHLQSAGYHVLRFTGSDIWRDPEGCAREVIAFIESMISRAKGETAEE